MVIVEGAVVPSLVTSGAGPAAMSAKATIPLFPTRYVSYHIIMCGLNGECSIELSCLMC